MAWPMIVAALAAAGSAAYSANRSDSQAEKNRRAQDKYSDDVSEDAALAQMLSTFEGFSYPELNDGMFPGFGTSAIKNLAFPSLVSNAYGKDYAAKLFGIESKREGILRDARAAGYDIEKGNISNYNSSVGNLSQTRSDYIIRGIKPQRPGDRNFSQELKDLEDEESWLELEITENAPEKKQLLGGLTENETFAGDYFRNLLGGSNQASNFFTRKPGTKGGGGKQLDGQARQGNLGGGFRGNDFGNLFNKIAGDRNTLDDFISRISSQSPGGDVDFIGKNSSFDTFRSDKEKQLKASGSVARDRLLEGLNLTGELSSSSGGKAISDFESKLSIDRNELLSRLDMENLQRREGIRENALNRGLQRDSFIGDLGFKREDLFSNLGLEMEKLKHVVNTTRGERSDRAAQSLLNFGGLERSVGDARRREVDPYLTSKMAIGDILKLVEMTRTGGGAFVPSAIDPTSFMTAQASQNQIGTNAISGGTQSALMAALLSGMFGGNNQAGSAGSLMV